MSKDKLLSDEELATKLIRIAKGIGKTYDDSIDAKLEQSMLNLINTQKRLYAESEKLKELNRVHFEPLIKDEKIRKAVRAWADACDVERCHYDGDGNFATRWHGITLDGSVEQIDEGTYTIAELCGEEE